MHAISRAVDLATNWLLVIAAFFAFGVAFVVLFDIVARALGIVFYGTSDYVKNMIVAIVFLWLPSCVKTDSMLRMDFALHAVPPRARAAMLVFGCLLGAFFFGAITIGAIEPTLESWRTGEVEDRGIGVTVPVWPSRAAILFGCAAAAFIYVLRAVEIVFGGPAARDALAGDPPGS